MRLPDGYRIMSLNINCLINVNSRIGLLEFIKRNRPTVLCLQEVNIPQLELVDMIDPLNYDGFVNFTESERGTAVVWRKDLAVSGFKVVTENRILSVDYEKYTIVNVYGHSGRVKRNERAQLFSHDLLAYLNGLFEREIVLCGDFNCILESMDAAKNPSQKKSRELKAIVSTNSLIDSYRLFHPNQPGYTFIRNDSASRIDYIFLSQSSKENIESVSLIPAPSSDHVAVCLELKAGNQQVPVSRMTSSYWKLNSRILSHPDFLDNFTEIYARLVARIESFQSVTEWWESCAKPQILMFLKIFSRTLATEQRQTKEAFYFLLKSAVGRGTAGFQEALELKHRIQDLDREVMEGVKVRSRFQENLEKERGSLFHLARERKNAKANNLESLIVDGNLETDSARIQTTVLEYFNKLFNGRLDRSENFVMDEERLPELLNDNLGKISDADKENISQLFSMDELQYVIKNLPNNKSPGLDGLTNELYKCIFPVIKNEYLAVQNLYHETEKIGKEMKRGVTRLIPKTTGVVSIEKVRPLTMLIPDYSIKSRLMTNRLSGVLEDIIKSGQLCSSKQVNIQTGVHNILSTIEYVNMKNLPGALLSFDMSKAFDRCYVPFVCKVLEKMNFPSKFINIIRDMHDGISTCFLLNGLSPEINLIFSVRQGDPLAMPLYTVYMEPLLVNLESVVKGIRVGDSNEVDEPYADDVEVLVDCEDDFGAVDEVFRKFESLSGAVLSRTEKSKVMGFGQWSNRDLWPLPWLKCVTDMKVFGFYICQDYPNMLKRNWELAVESVRKAVYSFDLRVLNTIHQRVDVLNVFVCPKLWYKCAVLPMPSDVAKKLESIMIKFLWRGKLEKLSLTEICNSKEDGGLGLVEIRSKADALLLKQTCRILSAQDRKCWSHLKYWTGLYFGRIFPSLRPGPHSERVPELYSQVKCLILEALEDNSAEEITKITAKEIYRQYTETLPPPKVVYKKEQVIWDSVWGNIHHPMFTVERREFLFLLTHNILPTGERIRRLNLGDGECDCGGGVETPEHLFFTCVRTQSAWAWMRRKMETVAPAARVFSEQDFLKLDFKSKILLWLISFYFHFVWNTVKDNKKDMNIEHLERALKSEFDFFQRSQNRFENVTL
jgi:exonuclease III